MRCKRFFVLVAISLIALSLCLTLGSCRNEEAKLISKIDELPKLSKGYFGAEHSTVELDLAPYIEKNGYVVTYALEISDSDVADVQISGDVLSATLKMGDATATIHIDAICEGKTQFSWDVTLEALKYTSVACVGDSLTQGHTWGNEAYPVYLEETLDGFEVMNFGKNGASITGTNPNLYLKYEDQPQYEESLECGADIVVIMLGTNDSKAWDMAKHTFKSWYVRLIESYYAVDPDVKIILVTAPPTLNGNKFDIPNDVIRDCVCPIQREVAEELGLPLVDLRAEMEALEGGYYHLLRESASYDGVHLSVEGAIFLAELIEEVIMEL